MHGSMNFFRGGGGGGGGGSGPTARKQSGCFLVLQQLILFQGSSGVQHFLGGGGWEGPDPLPPSGSAHENLHDVKIADLRCRAS